MNQCDPLTGVCSLPDAADDAAAQAKVEMKGVIHYVGDPMCSWCWGISPAVHAAQAYAAQVGLGFEMTMGGLRVGGGDPWNDEFKAFLRTEWHNIHVKTGQPMSYKILDKASFNYDTEPPSRAFAIAQAMNSAGKLSSQKLLDFYTAIQRTFYVGGLDPKDADFYQAACTEVGLDFDVFAQQFDSAQARDQAAAHFLRARQWGVRSFPTILLQKGGQLKQIAAGYVTAQALTNRLDAELQHA